MDEDASAKMHLLPEQATVITSVERAGASLSLVGVTLVIVTYIFFKRLRTVPNTFILFASIANIGASVASLIGLAGIDAGTESPLCNAQAFLLEMFMQSDPWWSFAMAVNVFMVFFFAANPTTFKRYLWIYCIICFGAPMVPAIVCLLIRSESRGPIYGNATLWCWIDDNWNSLRIFSYYIPIWVCIFLSAVIYLAVGYHVFHQRNQLRNMSLSNQGKDVSSSDVRESAEKSPGPQPTYYGTVTTEVQITSDLRTTPPPPPPPPPSTTSTTTRPPTPSPSALAAATTQCPWGLPDDDIPAFLDPHTASSSSTYHHHHHHHHHHLRDPPPTSSGIHTAYATAVPISTTTTASTSQPSTPIKPRPTNDSNNNNNKNRLSVLYNLRSTYGRFLTRLRTTDPVKLAYLRTSFVFAISVLVTWTPSSINRVYTLIHPDEVSYALNVASAAVLPLQGVWNAVIYFTTSARILREEASRLRWWRRRHHHHHHRGGGAAGGGAAFRMGSLGEADRFEAARRAGGKAAAGGGPLRRGDSEDLELGMRPATRVGTVRVQKGGELDG